MIRWRVVVNRVWGFSLRRGVKKDTHFRRYEPEHSDRGGFNKSEYRRGKSLLMASGVAIPSIIYLYHNLSPGVDINGVLSDWAETQDLVQGVYQVWGALAGLVTRQQVKGEITFTEYHRVEDIYMWLKNMQLANKQRLNLIKIGTTHEGRDILVAKLSSGDHTTESRRAIFLEGGIHGREWISSAALLNLIKLVIDQQEDFPDCDIYILPLANPDGYEISHSSRRMWRKNRGSSPNLLLSTFGLCKGTDLNRNFPAAWGENVTNLTYWDGSRLSCMETFIGHEPGSEPETRAIMEFVTEHKEQLAAYISFHSFGNILVYPDRYSEKVNSDMLNIKWVSMGINGYLNLKIKVCTYYEKGSKGIKVLIIINMVTNLSNHLAAYSQAAPGPSHHQNLTIFRLYGQGWCPG